MAAVAACAVLAAAGLGGACTKHHDSPADTGVDCAPDECRLPHADSVCTDTGCAIEACEGGFADCDGEPTTGCEAELETSREHCGGCANRCGELERCQEAECVADRVVDVDAGHASTCAALQSGRVYCWGAAPVAFTSATLTPEPTPVPGLDDAVRVAVRRDRACALTAAGNVSCWGDIDHDSDSPAPDAPREAEGVEDAVGVALGNAHTCVLTSESTVRCWGENGHGQLGDGTRSPRVTPVRVSDVSGATDVVAGSRHTCALIAGGDVACWGTNAQGQLGVDDLEDSTVPVVVPLITRPLVAVSASSSGVCGVRDDGRISCWGRPPVNVGLQAGAIRGAVRLSVGGRHACMVSSDGDITCWGGGPGTGSRVLEPSSVAIDDATKVTAGYEHTCAIYGGGKLACWGSHGAGQVGHRALPYRASPTPVPDLSNITQVDLGWNHTCATAADGTVHCWGDSGGLGDGSREDQPSPISVPSLSEVVQVSAGVTRSCAVHADGRVSCWGHGPPGDGAGAEDPLSYSAETPVTVSGIDDGVHVSAGWAYSCAVHSTGRVSCWGTNLCPVGPSGGSRLGHEAEDDVVATPVQVDGIDDAVAVAADCGHTCVVRESGAVSCWGDNERGQLGDGTRIPRLRPVEAVGIDSAVAVWVATDPWGETDFSCARLVDGQVMCWGGTGEGDVSSRPVRVLERADDFALSAHHATSGPMHRCALDTDGPSCWGHNHRGQLGTGSTNDETAPTPVDSAEELVQLDAGANHTCAVTEAGDVACWGWNRDGRLGLGEMTTFYEPIRVLESKGRG